MKTRKLVMALVIASLSLSTTAAMARQSVHLDASSLVWVRSVDEHFQSFQVGMSHLTGGETWRTYDPAEQEGGKHLKSLQKYENLASLLT